jgi:lysyl-tRNA synthetase class 2
MLPRIRCADLPSREQSPKPFRLVGRVRAVDAPSARVTLADDSGTASATVAGDLPSAGDIVELAFGRDDAFCGAPATEIGRACCAVLTPYRRDVPFPSPGGETYRLLGPESGATRSARLRARARLLRKLRTFLDEQGYLEIQTPRRVRHPALEPQLVAERAGWGYLITSPEYQLKRLLASDLERIYSVGSCWRGDERGPLHLNELCLLEWYQAHTTLLDLMDQTEELIRDLAQTIHGDGPLRWGGHSADLTRPFERLTVSEAFSRFAGIELSGAHTGVELRRRVAAAGLDTPADEVAYDQVFSRVLVEHVEPRLAELGAVFVYNYPTPVAALARRSTSDPSVAERAELYICGVELSNGFAELTDPDEQLQRFEHDRALRDQRGLPAHPIDGCLIEALREGIPPCSGNALGVDRLLMLLTGAACVSQVVAFDEDEL